MDDAGPPSLFVVLEYCYNDAPYFSILQLETQVYNHEYAAHLTPKEMKVDQEETPKEIDVDPEEYLVRFNEAHEPMEHPSIKWLFCPPTSSTEDLYMVPNWKSSPYWETVKPLHGYKFNFSTGRFGSIKAPTSSQLKGYVVNVKGDIYFMAHADNWFPGKLDTVFECYDHDRNSWKAPETFPHSRSMLGPIRATAVWGDILLLNANGPDIWAYDSSGNKLYLVVVKDKRCYNIVGEAIVLGDTIYALTRSNFDSVLALRIEKEGTGSDVVFKCSLRSEYFVQGMGPTSILVDERAWRRTRHFVHLGKDNFCLVQSCQLIGCSEYEPIQLTYIECKGENSMTVTGTSIHRVKILKDGKFTLRFCFSLPESSESSESSESKTTTLKEGKRFVFNFNPFAEDYASKPGQELGGADPLLLEPQLFTALGTWRDPDPSKLPASATSLCPPEQRVVEIRPPRQKPGKAAILKAEDPFPELGHIIYVRKLPPKANARQVEEAMKRFGRIKRIQVEKNEEGKCFACVEFRSATSKQRALEVSTISIGGRVAEILELREILEKKF